MVAQDVEDPDNVASILMTTHGEIPVDNQGNVTTFELSKDMGVDSIYYVSAVDLASDAINYGVRQVQERSAQELFGLYKNGSKPTLYEILNALKRPRNLDQTNTISGCPRANACSRYSDTLSFYGRHYSGRRAAELGMEQNNYDAQQYMKQLENGHTWQVVHLDLSKNNPGQFVNKEFVVVLSDEITNGRRSCAPVDNNALLLLPGSCGGAPCARQLIGNFKRHRSPDSFSKPDDPGYLQQSI